MARPVDEKNREKMKKRIAESAHKVFCKKGLIDVTMTDLIEAANMSRGGFYFYYKSVDEVFRHTINSRKIKNLENSRPLEGNHSFDDLIDNYFKVQKARLLNMENSMLRALYEYLFTHTGETDAEFRLEQKNNILDTVNAVISVGVEQNLIRSENIGKIAEHFMYTLEGLNAMALFQGLSEETIDQQFELLKNMLK